MSRSITQQSARVGTGRSQRNYSRFTVSPQWPVLSVTSDLFIYPAISPPTPSFFAQPWTRFTRWPFSIATQGIGCTLIISPLPDWSANEKTMDGENMEGHWAVYQGIKTYSTTPELMLVSNRPLPSSHNFWLHPVCFTSRFNRCVQNVWWNTIKW